jgi:hypothetical protein
MAEKLKSISRRIHWSLLVKAAAFGVAWFFFPFWFFLIIALYLYLIPLFQSRALFVPFAALLVLAYAQPPGLLFAGALAILFYWLLLIKDLIVIDRRTAYEILVIALSFFLLRDFYRSFGAAGLVGSTAALCYAFLAAGILGVMVSSFIGAFSAALPLDLPAALPAESDQQGAGRGKARIAGWLVFLISWQFIILGLALPLDFIYQSVIVFLVVAFAMDLISGHSFGVLSRQMLITASTTIFAVLAIVLTAARWGL